MPPSTRAKVKAAKSHAKKGKTATKSLVKKAKAAKPHAKKGKSTAKSPAKKTSKANPANLTKQKKSFPAFRQCFLKFASAENLARKTCPLQAECIR